MPNEQSPRFYTQYADWWQLLSPAEDYAEEAEFFRQAIIAAADRMPRTMLEFGSGGGNNASYLKQHFELTLTDLSAAMLGESRKLNPQCEHVAGDMRSLQLGRPQAIPTPWTPMPPRRRPSSVF